MDKEVLENYLKAGKILEEILKKARKTIKPGQKLLEIAEDIEKSIEAQGAMVGPAFPVNLSLNNFAAHYTPSSNDETMVGEKDVLTVDIGVHVSGFIADAAFTLDFSGKWSKMLECNEKALEEAAGILKEGLELGKIGEVIEKRIKGAGFNVIQNLTGHGLEQWIAHASPSIPNLAKKDSRTLEDDMVFAIEPFATNGEGFVKETPQSEIFQVDRIVPVRNTDARKMLEFVLEKYHTLPFAERWIDRELGLSEFKRKVALRELMMKKCIKAFPILKEEEGKIVSQFESSFLINEGRVVRLV